MAKAGRGQPVVRRTPTVPQPGASGGNYFAGVLDELRKVVWPTWDELGRMTGVVITTVVLMAVIISTTDFVLGKVVQQLYTSANSTTVPGSRVSAQPTVRASPKASSAATSAPATTAPSTPGGSTTAPVTP